jgi:hypothetical protein
MDMIAVVAVTLTGLMVVLLRDSVTAAQSGLALSCVFAVSSPALGSSLIQRTILPFNFWLLVFHSLNVFQTFVVQLYLIITEFICKE